MKQILMIAALGRELKALRKLLPEPELLDVSGFRVAVSQTKTARVILVACSVGKVNAALCTQMMIHKYRPDMIINTGIAGGLQEYLHVGDLIIAEEAAYHDIETYILEGAFPYQKSFFTDGELLNGLLKTAAGYEKPAAESELPIRPSQKIYSGLILTGDSFISCDTKKESLSRLAALQNQVPLCVDMESAAIAHTAYINQIPFASVRAISDTAGKTAREEYQNNEWLAADTAGTFILHYLQKHQGI